ncbi:rhodanese-like domain-containing protein [Actinomarinicola tropica]|uniref:rhodanese-like domain-containing protein n=1 Tax=Actinomarinicola tropica TaxID=2789776 RepID=UPI001E599047|nr:rhodanese-like domain-containing protein [Actinomarinicola tropica]
MNLFSRLTASATSIPAVDVETAASRSAGTVLVDVREPDEWSAGHAPGAVHVPLGSLDPERLPAADVVFVICRSGNRSAMATQALRAVGIDARNVEGGMGAWQQAGLPVERG